MKNKIILILFLFLSSAVSAQNTWNPPLIGGSTSWTNNSNWSAGHFPLASEDVVINLALLNASQPVIANGTAAVCKSLTFNAVNGLSLTVNGTLTVSGTGAGTITQNPPTVSLLGLGGTVVNTITGTGTVTCSSLQVGNTNFLSVGALTSNQVSLISTVNSLQISGDVNIYGTTNAVLGVGVLQNNNSAFYVRGGTTTVGGQLYTNTSVSPTGISLTLGTAATANIYVDVPSGSSLNPVLKLTNATPIKSGSNAASIDFYSNGGGSGTCTVEYAGSGQTVYTESTSQLDISPTAYQNINFSATGTKTINSGDLTIYGDWNSASTSGKVDAITNNPNVYFKGVTESLTDAGSDGGNGVVFKNVFVQNSGTKTMSGAGKFSVSSLGILTMAGTATLATGGILTLISDASGSATVASIPSGTAITGNVNAQRYINGGSGHRGYRLLASPINNGSGAFTLAYLKANAYVTGTTLAAGGFDPSPNANNPTIYFFRENTARSISSFTSGNYRGLNNINSSPYSFDSESGTFTLYSGNGFLFFFRGDRSTTIAQATVVSHIPENTTFTATGSLNQGNITVKHWYTGTTSLLYTNTTGSRVQGYNLVGNPYASTINFEKLNRKGVSGGNADPSSSIYISGQKAQVYTTVTANIPPVLSMWVYNPINKQYESYQQNANQITAVADTTTTINPGIQSISGGAASNMIASGQGFFIRATATGQTMAFSESAKTNTQPPLSGTLNKILSIPDGKTPLALMSTKQSSFAASEPAPSNQPILPLIRLQLIKDSLNMDGIAIVLVKDISPAFDKNKDTEDLGGSGALESLSALSSDSVQVAIHRRPLPGKTQETIRLLADATASGPYKLKLTDLKDLPDLYDVWLKDSFLKDSVNIKTQAEYNFNIDKSNTATFGTDRLQLIVRQNQALMVHLLSFDAKRINESAQVTWFAENEANYTTYVVERSTDNGKTFDQVGTLNSTGAKSYSLNDKTPAQGLNQYRLKQIDLNGDATYSKIAPVMFTNKPQNTLSANMNLYPNPATDVIHAEMQFNNGSAIKYKINITNSEGKLMATATSSQANWQNNVASYVPGTYIMQVVNSNDNTVVGFKKFIKK
ncbi:T9SS type A sorting domain-containing protein [Mucilaginibacter kameinonensis]|uniref:T9SS type A sorting domain-containing protein n=1 Tax=Mucilaginibacter kameinonensis TaxID=452286 RepID=UPI000EF8164F|nr:T9SS type A sorting domain-containing protein [Mucilaginibacter kameinonensis]